MRTDDEEWMQLVRVSVQVMRVTQGRSPGKSMELLCVSTGREGGMPRERWMDLCPVSLQCFCSFLCLHVYLSPPLYYAHMGPT